MVQTSLSTQTKVVLVGLAAVATGLAAYALGYTPDLGSTPPTAPDKVANQSPPAALPAVPTTPDAVNGAAVANGFAVSTNPPLPNAMVGVIYDAMLTVNGGTAGSWYLSEGALPAGLVLETNGRIHGTPTSVGTTMFGVKVVSNDSSQSAAAQLTLEVLGSQPVLVPIMPTTPVDQPPANTLTPTPTAPPSSPTAPLSIVPLPKANVGQVYQQQLTLTGSGADANYAWGVSAATPLPAGFHLSDTGVLSGTPTTNGDFQVTLLVKTPTTDTVSLTTWIEVLGQGNATTPANTPVTKPDAPVAPTPATPAAPVVPSLGGVSAGSSNQPFIGGGFPDGVIGTYYSAAAPGVSGGLAPYTWRLLSGNLPSGLSLTPFGALSGYPNQYGIYTFTLQIRDQNGNYAQAARSISIRPAYAPNSYQGGSAPDAGLANRLNHLTYMGVQVHDLIKLQDDGDPNTQADTTVYYVGIDGRRHAFPNNRVYFSWFPDYSRVRIVAANALADIPLGANVTYRPGTRLVKFLTDPRVYAIDANSTLRWVKTEASAAAFYGPFWNRQVDDIADTFYTDYHFGQDINYTRDYSVSGAMSTAAFPSDVLPRP